ncbi:MAG TPA: hypothetical protein VN903_12060 [Polyangia bacterium]|nr:hypothetical protein [Polyangia bacterium]
MTTTRQRRQGIFFLAALLGAGACSGGDSTTFSPSLPPGSPLNQLTPAQRDTLCSEIGSFTESSGAVDAIAEVLCRAAGISAAQTSNSGTDAEARSTCTQRYDACRMALVGGSQMCAESAWAAASCTATVAALAACLNDSVAEIESAARTVPACSTLTLADLGAFGGIDLPSPQTCQTLERDCPGASGGGGETNACTAPTEAALSAWEGIYQLSSYTENKLACDAEGASVLGQKQEPYFAAVLVSAFGKPYLQIASCTDLANCGTKVAAIRGSDPYGYEFGVTLQCANTDGSLGGSTTFSGVPSDHGTCDMPTLQDAALTRVSPTTIRIDTRTYTGDSYPQDAQGICWTSGSNASTSSPCTLYDVLTGDFVEALPQ